MAEEISFDNGLYLVVGLGVAIAGFMHSCDALSSRVVARNDWYQSGQQTIMFGSDRVGDLERQVEKGPEEVISGEYVVDQNLITDTPRFEADYVVEASVR